MVNRGTLSPMTYICESGERPEPAREGNPMKSPHIVILMGGMLLLTLIIPAFAADEGILNDANITLAVDRHLLADEGVFSHLIDIATENGVVMLTGTVDHLLARERATKIAARIKGVRDVVNNLEVQPPLPLDEPLVRADPALADTQIRQYVQQALQTDPAVQADQVEVAVTDRIVSLTGTVDSWQSKALVARVVSGVKDIRALENQLSFPMVERPDAEIEQDIRNRLRWDVWVDAGLITIRVADGHVNLSGKVKSMAEKLRSAADAWVAGVGSVDADEIEVAWWIRDELRRLLTDPPPSDEAIAQAVANAFRYEPRLAPSPPGVSVDGGIVTITGAVDHLAAKQTAEDSAKDIVGVWRVMNHLRVRPPSPPSDAQIAKTLEAALVRDVFVERHEIKVAVRNGKVTLVGPVDSHFERRRAAAVAARVGGVIESVNHLVIPQTLPEKLDWQIRLDLDQRLWWSPFVDSEAIEVSVEDDVATLTGIVDNWLEHSVATRSAYEAGALQVRDRLKIRRGPAFYRP